MANDAEIAPDDVDDIDFDDLYDDEDEEDNKRGGIKVKCPYCGTRTVYGGDKDNFSCANEDCNVSVELWHGRLKYFAEQPNLRLLAHRGPLTRDEFEEATDIEFRWTTAMNAMADKIEPAPARNGSSAVERDTDPEIIYYLHGDERRAISKFIEENPKLVHSAMNTKTNRLRQKWPDFMYEMLIEQWELLGYGEYGNAGASREPEADPEPGSDEAEGDEQEADA